MKNSSLQLGLVGLLLLSGVGFAQDRDSESPSVGDGERGRTLLAILGPKPDDGTGVSPLQQQELNRRVRCAATRQEIQDQLDFEAAGSVGFYPMAELRSLERETCAPVPVQPAFRPAPPPRPVGTYQPPPQLPVAPPSPPPQPPPPPKIVQQAPAPRPAAQPQPLAPSPPQQSVKPPANAQLYTPTPEYPHDDMVAGHQGTVVVRLVMNPDGSVKSASVAQSSTFPTLDASALKAATTWRIPAAAGKTIIVPLKFYTH